MDNERRKRQQFARIALTEAIMVVSIVVIVALLMFMVMGYSLKNNDGEWQVEQSGRVQLVSTPSGASIEVDGEGIFQRTETSRMLSEGSHTIKFTREGYDSWEKTISVRSGYFLRLKYPRLFKADRKAETAKTFENLNWARVADNRNTLLYTLDGDANWHWLSLKDDALTETEIDVSEFFSGEVQSFAWAGSGEKALVKVFTPAVEEGEGVSAAAEKTEWFIIDLRRPERSLNLTTEFGFDFSSIQPANEAADKLWALENGNLRELYPSNKETTSVLVSGVLEFDSYKENVVYVAKNGNAGERVIGTYQEGASDVVIAKKVKDAETKVAVALEEYLGDYYFSYLLGQTFHSFKAGNFPIAGQKFAMDEVLKVDLKSAPESFVASEDGQFVRMRSGAHLAVFDAETEQVYEQELENDQYFWLDDYLVATVVDGKLVARDFDGTNKRTLASAISPSRPAFLALNNKYLYYFSEEDELTREEL